MESELASANCTDCQAEVTVRQGACLLGHPIDPSTVTKKRGRHAAGPVLTLPKPRTATRFAAVARPSGRTGMERPARSTALLEAPIQKDRPAPTRSTSAESSHHGQAGRSTLPLLDMLGFVDLTEDELDIGVLADRAPASLRLPAGPRSTPPQLETAIAATKTVAKAAITTASTLARRLWEAPAGDDQPAPWRPRAVALESLDDRRYRWTVIGLCAVLGLAVVAGIGLLVSRPAAVKAQLVADHRQAAADLAAAIPDARQAAASLGGDGNTAAITSALAALDDAARRVFSVASVDGPTPGAEASEADSVEQRATELASEALGLETEIGDAWAYQLTLTRMLDVPLLPVSATPDELAALAATLSTKAADFLRFDENAPTSEGLASVGEALHGWTAGLSDWQVAYLDSLRMGDSTAAVEYRNAFVSGLEALRSALDTDLAAVRTTAVSSLDELATRLEAFTQSL